MSDVQIIFTPTTTEKVPTPLDLDALSSQFGKKSDWSIPEAYMCLILAAAFCDGELASEEKQEIAALVMRSRTMKTLPAAELAKVNVTVNERMKVRPTALEEACNALPPDMRLSVFAHCVDIVLADGELRQSEADFLNRATTFLRIDADKAKQVLAAIMLKNSY
jgi:uncharacterized tellurite resistance protein B-like protein